MKSELIELFVFLQKHVQIVDGKPKNSYSNSERTYFNTVLIDQIENANCGNIIRRYDRVTIEEKKQPNTIIKRYVHDALSIPDEYCKKYQPELYEIKMQIQELIRIIIDGYYKNDKIYSAIFDSIGFKTYQILEIPLIYPKENAAKYEPVIIIFFLEKLIDDFMIHMNCFDVQSFLNFNPYDWFLFHNRKYLEICRRKNYQYKVIYFLNSPICLFTSEIPLGRISIDGKTVSLFGSYVSDDDLELIADYFPDKSFLTYINTKISFNASIAIDESVENFENLYSEAEAIGKKL